jgi:hypothetical protein
MNGRIAAILAEARDGTQSLHFSIIQAEQRSVTRTIAEEQIAQTLLIYAGQPTLQGL